MKHPHAIACIFDFDGTIIDSEKYHHKAWENVAKTLKIEFSYEEYRPFKSAGRQAVIPYLFNKAGVTLTDELYKKYYDLRQKEITKTLKNLSADDFTPGAIKFIKLLKNNNLSVAVASASASATATAKKFGIYDLFDVFVDGSNNLPPKPNPDIFLYTANLLGMKPENCVVFEDSINGLKSAKNANMKVIGIQTYFTDIADKIIDDFNVGLEILDF